MSQPFFERLSGTCLLLDAAVLPIRLALVVAGRVEATEASSEEALHGIFRASSSLLETTGLAWHKIDGFIYGSGPGTVLGLRLAAIAIEGWRGLREEVVPIYQYNTLQATACAHMHRTGEDSFDLLISVRRDRVGRLPIRAGTLGTMLLEERELTGSESGKIPRYHLASASNRLPQPPASQEIEFDPTTLPPGWFTGANLKYVSAAEPEIPSPATYQKWSGERHGAP